MFNALMVEDEDIGELEKEECDTITKDFIDSIGLIAKNIRKSQWTYLCRHPEIRAIIRVIAIEAIDKKPNNIYYFSADLFKSSNTANLIKMINKQLKYINKELNKGAWSSADGEMHFTASSDDSLAAKKEHYCPTNTKSEMATGLDPCAATFVPDNECPETFKPFCEP